MGKQSLTLDQLKKAAGGFARTFSERWFKKLYGVTDGKAIGTFVEKKFHEFLGKRFSYTLGSPASGIDFPDPGLQVDLKVTSIKQPQSSCPFREASQKVYGLGHHLLVFAYKKEDNARTRRGRLLFTHVIFVSKERTADYQTTKGILDILGRGGNKDDIVAFLEERNLPLDEIGRESLAERILKELPKLGCLTISRALQWRLQYGRILEKAGEIEGVENLLE